MIGTQRRNLTNFVFAIVLALGHRSQGTLNRTEQ